MAQQRQSGMERFGVRDLHHANGAGDHVAVGIRGAAAHKQPRLRRSARSDRSTYLSVAAILVFLFLVLVVTVLAFSYISRDEISSNGDDNDDLKSDSDFLTNVPRIQRKKVLDFGHASGGHGRDSRYWDRDDRRRDGDYDEDMMEQTMKSSKDGSDMGIKRKGVGLYNEAGRHELKSDSKDMRGKHSNSDVLGLNNEVHIESNDSFGSCEMKLLNSTSQLVEPLESRKFARFNLQYTDKEEKPPGEEHWVPRFAGHQSLEERENSFLARDQKIKCGFVKGPEGSQSTGFDLTEDDASYISRCHIAVISCIFGNSDRLRTPATKTVTRLSRKNVCFVMFTDEITIRTLSSEGHVPDRMGFIGFWKLVVVKNLPFDDMRRVGKIPKLLPHRLFPFARYSIWLDSKLRLQLDPLLILEYFLWRKGYEFAISNHYDRHCVWEEVAQNKRLNKYNHTVIDQQFAFYRADGLEKFDASDPNKLLPSNVPEGSFIIRAHTPMSNLFSCLWFNEVDRFTPRDQLSFAYTYQKLRRMNPEKPFHLNMFKDCERRHIAKLFRHRLDEKRISHQKATE
uniref:TOD1/MUCI70 glycosyltransferase-like domain-containing protein n=1 Tax=Cajanus cajan TaxID=3821 RepID=A0A151U5X2_CAJCA|nr:hypothetical protein KK1_007423 [Cajanus cajan]